MNNQPQQQPAQPPRCPWCGSYDGRVGACPNVVGYSPLFNPYLADGRCVHCGAWPARSFQVCQNGTIGLPPGEPAQLPLN